MGMRDGLRPGTQKRRACHEQKYDRSMQTVMGDFRSEKMINKPVTRQEIEQKMDTLAREFAETHDLEIPEEIYGLARQLRGDEEPVRLLFHEVDSGVAAVAKIRSLGLKRSSTTNLK